MALRIWLPLNGSLENKGISDITVTNNGATVDNNGKIGKCYSFNGSYIKTDYSDYPNIFSGDFSICFWVYSTTNKVRDIYFANYGLSGSGNWFNLERDANNYLRFWWANGSPDYHNNNFIINQNEWTHIVVTRLENTLTAYKNGNLINTYSTTLSNAIPSTATTFYLGADYRTGQSIDLYGKMNDIRIYDHCLSPLEVKEISQGLVLHYKLDNSSITNYSEIGNLIPNYKEMGLGTANVETGTWRTAGANNMTRTRVQITDSPVGECYCFQNSGIQTANDGSCYGIDNTTYFEPNTEYRISMFARITSGTEGYAGYAIHNISEELGGSHTKIDKNYRVTPLSADGSWTYCWYHFKTNSTATRNIYIGITTGETSVTTQMCLIRIDKWNDGMGVTKIKDSSGYEWDGTILGTVITEANGIDGRYLISSKFNENADSVTIPPCFSVGQTQTEMTTSIWAKTNTLNSTTPNLMSLGENGFWRFRLASASSVWWYIRVGDTQRSATYSISGKNLLDNNWHHYAITFKNGIIVFYIDGVQIGTTDWSNSVTYVTCNNAGNTWHLAGYSTTSESFIGNLADARIYTTALSTEDIATLYHTPAQVDNLGEMHGFEFKENETKNLSDFSIDISNNWTSEGVTRTYFESDIGPALKVVPSSGNKRMYHNVTDVWENEKSYIVSFIAKADQDGAILRASRSIANFAPNFNLTTSWKKYYGIITSTVTTNSGTLSIDYQTSTNYYITDIKLEEANQNLISILKNGITKENWIDENNFNNNAKFLKESSVVVGNNFIEK